MQYVGFLTARLIKNYYVFKLHQLSRHIISKKKIIIIIIMLIKIIIIKYMHSNYSDQSVQSEVTNNLKTYCVHYPNSANVD